jgi:8-oxo-dGTP diphosphatase
VLLKSLPVKTIGIAVVVERDHVLVGIRLPDQPLAGLAEFPGGKCEPGETPASCAVRETLEEAGLRVRIAEPLANYPWDFPHGRVDLHFFLCRPSETIDIKQACDRFRWVPIEELAALKFPAANAAVIDRLLDRRPIRSAPPAG